MKIIQLLLSTMICILLSPQPISSDPAAEGPSPAQNVQNPQNATVPVGGPLTNTLPAGANPIRSNQTSPTDISCDRRVPNTCPGGLMCGGSGKCSCPGNMVYSLPYGACKIRAGGHGCSRSGECVDGAHCWHPQATVRCFGFGCHHHHHYGPQGPTTCDCKCAPMAGIDGFCNPYDERSGECTGSACLVKSGALSIIMIIGTSLLILSI